MADTVGKGKEIPTATVTDVLKRLTAERALNEDNQDPAQTQRHLSQLQTLEFVNTAFSKEKEAIVKVKLPKVKLPKVRKRRQLTMIQIIAGSEMVAGRIGSKTRCAWL
jgi:hypothetical protein